MNIMKKIYAMLLAVLLLGALPATAASAWTVPAENLRYDIMYKWGLVNKKPAR